MKNWFFTHKSTEKGLNVKKVNIADYQSRWEYTKATSRWHFDPKVDEDLNPAYCLVGRFTSSFDEVIEQALHLNTPTTMNNRLRTNEVPFTAQLEKYDMEKIGLSTDHVLFNEVRKDSYVGEWPLVIQQMIKFFGFKKLGLGVAIHVQYPGQVFPLHIDAFPFLKQNQEHHILDEHPDQAARFTIQFKNWEWGHIWGYGNTYWKQWQAGEIAFHSWRDLPHCTANAGLSPRVSAQVSGIVTDRTRLLIAQAKENLVLRKELPQIDLSQIAIGTEETF